MQIIRSTDNDVVKITNIFLDIVSSSMKGESVQEGIYKSFPQGKLFIERRKRGEKFITLIIYVN